MTDRPNVLLLVGAGHRHDCLGARGGSVETPTLDGLAERGVDFRRAYAPAATPTPARVGLLTGLQVPRTGVYAAGDHLPAGVETLPARLGSAGYDTCAVGALGLGGNRQFAGFDHRPYGDLTEKSGGQFDPPTNPKARGTPFSSKVDGVGGTYGHRYDPMNPDRRAPDPWRALTEDAGPTGIPESARADRAVVAEATDWLRDRAHRSSAPWLLCASFDRPRPPLTAPPRHVERHEPGDLPAVGTEEAPAHPLTEAKRDRDAVQDTAVAERVHPDEEQVRRSRAAYRGSVAYLDETVGDLLATLEREGHLSNTVVVYAGAAGSLLGEHGLWWDGTWHEAVTRVPLLVQTPAHRRGDRADTGVDTPVSLLDVAPTLCSLAGVEGPDADGADLSATVDDGESPARAPVITDALDPRYGEGTEFRVAVDGERKYVRVREGADLCFDVVADPMETDPLDGEGRSADAASVDFAAVAERRVADRAAAADADLLSGGGTSGNAYVLPDGRLVDADLELYKPDTLAEDAERVFADWPGENEE
jgi:choline-sulfatase